MRRLATALLFLFSVSLCAQKHGWLGTWATANVPMGTPQQERLHLGEAMMTVRQVVHLSQGGTMARVKFTNEFGTAPLHISSAHVAFLAAGSKILIHTDKPLLFSGQPGVTIPAGGFVASDAVKQVTPAYGDLVITMVLPVQPIPVVTHHSLGLTATYIVAGDRVGDEQFAPLSTPPPGLAAPDVAAPIQQPDPLAKPIVRQNAPGAAEKAPGTPDAPLIVSSYLFLKDVEVDSGRKSKAVVCFGDSITDGVGSTPETDRRYPDQFSGLLSLTTHEIDVAVLNAGISGNQLLQDDAGPKASDRFDRDVLTQQGVTHVILLEGINDIGHGGVTAQQVIDAMTALAVRAHAKRLRIYGATLTPFEGAKYYTPEREAIRQQVNAFLRQNTVFDGVIDFDKATQDPQHPSQFLPKNDHGDHLHPSDLGYTAMASAINVKWFRKK
ncbi:SGNH/GDSL hydrolase family protein [Terriglobus sp.]|uniref:SGNH/GDSL hydrolase family protein n=1 Tax=Terriglobus sp. TaxID=1889013 RepID=UPI003B007B6F